MKTKFCAAVASLGLALGGLAVVPSPAAADVPCTITGFSPRSVTVGLTPSTQRFRITTSGCESVESWDLEEADYLFYVYDSAPQETFNPYNDQRGYHSVIATATNGDWETTERTFANGFTLKRRAAFQNGTFNASPEPVTKAKPITVKGRLMIADWDRGAYYGYGNQRVAVQFRTPTGAYATVKTITTRSDGWASTTVTASRTGVWRLVYAGHSAAGSASVTGDSVEVR